MRTPRLNVFVAAVVLSLPLAQEAQSQERRSGPIVHSGGTVFVVAPDFPTPIDQDYRVAFDIAAPASSPDAVNSSINTVARFLNMHARNGIPAENVDEYISGAVSFDDVVEGGIPKDGWDFVCWTENGRSIIPMAAIEDAADLHNVPPVKCMGILNRDEGADACTPGILVAAKALLDEKPDPTETEVRYWLAGNLCRCTGYDKIVRAVMDAAEEMRSA